MSDSFTVSKACTLRRGTFQLRQIHVRAHPHFDMNNWGMFRKHDVSSRAEPAVGCNLPKPGLLEKLRSASLVDESHAKQRTLFWGALLAAFVFVGMADCFAGRFALLPWRCLLGTC